MTPKEKLSKLSLAIYPASRVQEVCEISDRQYYNYTLGIEQNAGLTERIEKGIIAMYDEQQRIVEQAKDHAIYIRSKV